MTGPLAGIRVLEIGSIGPGPFCAMVTPHGVSLARSGSTWIRS